MAQSNTVAEETPNASQTGWKRFFPRIGSAKYHLLLSAAAIFVIGPLGGISAAYMNFSIGIFVAGQILAGIMGSAVTLAYGPEGKHSANYLQTMAASVAGMCAMGPIIQAMIWLGLPQPPAWQMILYFLSIGMFGVGVGMLYTPVVVDRLQLTYPSGLAVANILRALTDKTLLKRSIARLGGSVVVGYIGSFASTVIPTIGATGLSMSTLGGGMIVGARIAIPPMVVATIGRLMTPYLVSIGWLNPNDPYRRIGFIISLGGIMGAASLDMILILAEAFRRLRSSVPKKQEPVEDWKRTNMVRLWAWVLFWGGATVWVGSHVLHQPIFYLSIAVGLCFLFVLTNGIAMGISDFNPISSAFVMSVFILAAAGLHDPGIGLLCAAILAIATSEGGDMQQDRSTGWRLGTNRTVQFRYQALGIAAGAVLMVALTKLFISAYPILNQDQFANPHIPGAEKWQSAFTYKMVGAIRGITRAQPQVMKALALGISIGVIIEFLRKAVRKWRSYREFTKASRLGRTVDFVVDATILPSPYAFALGGFVEFITVVWWMIGGVGASLYDAYQTRAAVSKADGKTDDLPADMSTVSLVGGGQIAGDALAALSIGVYGLLKAML